MVNYFGVTVSRLIRARCYAGGEKYKLERHLAVVSVQLQEAEANYSKLKEDYRLVLDRIAELDAEIKAKTDIDPEQIGSRVAMARIVKHQRHGTMVAELVKLFIDAGRPLSTTEIRAHMTTRFGVPTTTAAERKIAHHWVRDKLKYLTKKGAIIPLHTVDSRKVGLWGWNGL